jgi:hypothetical protein
LSSDRFSNISDNAALSILDGLGVRADDVTLVRLDAAPVRISALSPATILTRLPIARADLGGQANVGA